MQGQTIIPAHDVDELLISTVVWLIQRRAFPNLRNIIAKTHSVDIARWFPRLRVARYSGRQQYWATGWCGIAVRSLRFQQSASKPKAGTNALRADNW